MSPLTGRKTSRLLVMCNDVAFNQSLKVQTKTKTIYENVTKIVDQRIAVSELLILEVLLFFLAKRCKHVTLLFALLRCLLNAASELSKVIRICNKDPLF